MPGTGGRWWRGRRGRHKHAFPPGRSSHCNDFQPGQAGRWTDIFRFGCCPDTDEPIPPKPKHTSVLIVPALQMPNEYPLRLDRDPESDPQPFGSIRCAS